jgi:hypothetical protein
MGSGLGIRHPRYPGGLVLGVLGRKLPSEVVPCLVPHCAACQLSHFVSTEISGFDDTHTNSFIEMESPTGSRALCSTVSMSS